MPYVRLYGECYGKIVDHPAILNKSDKKTKQSKHKQLTKQHKKDLFRHIRTGVSKVKNNYKVTGCVNELNSQHKHVFKIIR